MIRVISVRDITGAGREVITIPFCGQTPADILRQNWRRDWVDGEAIGVILLGRRLTDDELYAPVSDGAELTLLPDPSGIEVSLGTVLVSLLVTAAATTAAYLLSPKPKTTPQRRNEEESPAYTFDIATDHRGGFPVPIVFGEHDLGGTAIYTEVYGGESGNERLTQLNALCQGPIHSIGGITTDKDEMGGYPGSPVVGDTIPTDVRVNGNRLDTTQRLPGALIYTRLGSIGQDPLPNSIGNRTSAFTGARTTETVNETLDTQGQEAIHTITNTSGLVIETVRLVFHFPAGLYYAFRDDTWVFTPLLISIAYREVGLGAWRVVNANYDISTGKSVADRRPWTATYSFTIQGGATDDIEVRVIRNTPAEGNPPRDSAVSSMIWRQLIYGLNQDLAYPGTALLGVIAVGSEKIGGGATDILCRVKGAVVRVFRDPLGPNNDGISGYYDIEGERVGDWFWELPPAGNPYNGIWTYPPGQNPAWQCIELLTNPVWGLGEWVTDDMIDWPQFRNWADYCDRDVLVDVTNEAGHTCNVVIDAPTPAFDALQRIASAGRASLLLVGDKISVRYNYFTAHGRDTNSVPTKAAVQLISSANVDDFQMTYTNPHDRAGVMSLQILDEDHDFAPEQITLDDPDGGFNDPANINPIPFRKETIESFGVTRRSQALRECHFIHRANRLVTSECSFKVGPDALAATVGDVVAVQHFAIRPFSTESFGYRTFQAGSGDTINLDHEVTLVATTTYAAVVRESNGDVTPVTCVAAQSGTFAPGDGILITTTVSFDKGAVIVFGVSTAVTRDYEIRDISLNADLTRSITAILYDSSIHADVDVGASSSNLEFGGTDVEAQFIARSNAFRKREQEIPAPLGTRIVKRLDRGHDIAFAPGLNHETKTARVFIRSATATVEDGYTLGDDAHVAAEVPWSYAGETTTGHLRVRDLIAHATYDVAVTQANQLGAFPPPQQGLITSALLAEEFPFSPPPAPSGLRTQQIFEGHYLAWDPVDYPYLAYYEVRETDSTTTRWHGAQRPMRTRQNSITLPPMSGTTYILRTRSVNGLYSEPVTIASGTGIPENESNNTGTPAVWSETNLNGSAATGYTGITAGNMTGQATASVASSLQAEQRLLITGTFYWVDTAVTVDDLTFAVDSGEAMWWLCDGRPASPEIPGINFGLTIDDIDPNNDVQLDSQALANVLVGGYDSQPGDHGEVRVLVDYDSSGTFEDYVPTRRVFTDVDIQIDFYRENEDYQVYSTGIAAELYSR